jgi:hypothetical protein
MNDSKDKKYFMSEELENRFYQFAFDVKTWCKSLIVDYIDKVYVVQLVRSSSSVLQIILKHVSHLERLTKETG